MGINEKQDEIIGEFDLFDDQLDKTQYIIDLGKKLKPLADDKKTDENLIRGCQSKVWLTADYRDGRVVFEGDGEPTAQIAKGLISILIDILSGRTATEIAEADLYFIEKVGMSSLVTSRRAGGLAAMIQKMKSYGAAYAKISV